MSKQTPLTQLLEEQKKEFDKLVAEDYEYKLRDSGVQEKLNTLLTTAITKGYELALEEVEEKAEYNENPIEDNGELIDGGYYLIYKGDLAHLKETI